VEEKQMKVSAPDVVQLERRGSQYIMSVAHFGEPFSTEEITDIDINDDVYVGLFVCAHNKKLVEKVAFDNVRLTIPVDSNYTPYRDYIGSQIETLDVFSGKRKILYTSPESLQAPNWSHDGKNLIYNSKGLMYRFDLQTKKPGLINTGFVKNNNNDHVISFDGKMLGLSSASGDPKFGSMIYTVSVDGGTPKQITPTGPSYLHGWSPDGKWLTFTGQRNNEFDIYKVPSNGGDEIRLTTTPGLDDGSEFSPDGKYIYFNSVRSGTMQLWRMKPDGSDPEQLTNDEFNNWFPHVSPDGKWIAFLSFMNDVKPDDHPFYKHVYLRLMPFNGGSPKVIAYVYGGQGSINTPSWSPDSKKIAFVSNTKVSE
jgi:Tol biopolymer transport system component